ncbi:SMODS domain-containing nucleotidyltransferase [Spongiibacter marinus]|uniref:SMODS domain-containing nucleotidyltransferase n=1 Tax=Spongiibacter marinus TaxID=354246 RepID=UPI00195F77B6|nr:hypothetical protein [Spongiibacter marinus]
MMSVKSHLDSIAYGAILRDVEKDSIQTSISTIQTRLGIWFSGELDTHFAFGSYTRGTILPRAYDQKSDIDYMVVFSDASYKPQTYIAKLKRFAEVYYSTSEIFQSSPTLVLNLNHIKFELVPGKKGWLGDLEISAPASDYSEWIETSPNTFNTELSEKNKQHDYNIKPMIRVLKYWNANAGYVFPSYELEQHLVRQWYWSGNDLKSLVYTAFDSLELDIFAPSWKQQKVAQAKQVIASTKYYENAGLPVSAESEITKILPDV